VLSEDANPASVYAGEPVAASSAAGVSDALAMGGASLLFGSFVTDGAQEKDLRDKRPLEADVEFGA